MRVTLALALLLLSARPQPGVEVVLRDGHVVVRTVAVPLAEVLARFAETTGTQIVYEAARPRQPVSVSIEAGSPAEAIAQLLEGQGLNYALRLDPAGRNVDLLVITGGTSTSGASDAAGRPSRAAPIRPPEAEEQGQAEPGSQVPPFSAEMPDELEPPGETAIDTPAPAGPWMRSSPPGAPGPGSSGQEAAPGAPGPEPSVPQSPGAASYPAPAPVSPPASPPVHPVPVSYP